MDSSKSNRRKSIDIPPFLPSEGSQTEEDLRNLGPKAMESSEMRRQHTKQQRSKPRRQDTSNASGITMATNSNVSEKYKDIISKSTLIRSGSPALYQLRPKEEKIGTLTRKTFGERNHNKINKTILLVGETGTGKSTLINTLVNYAMGVKFEDDIWFKIIEEEKRSQSECQTSDVVVYEIFGFEGQTLPFSLTMIDTPGYGDTRGIEHDGLISQKLLDLFRSEEGVNELSAVGLVMKATENRVSERQMYVFSSMMSLFGKNMEKNIVALLTHSNGRKPKNVLEALDAAKIKCARDEKNQPVHFLFDNCQHEDRTEDKEVLEQADKVSMRGIRQFMDFMEKNSPVRLKKTVEVLNEHVELKACIQNLQERVELIEMKQKEISQMEDIKNKYGDNLTKNEEFTEEVDEVYKEKEVIFGGWRWFSGYSGAVTCNICKENCHHPCTIAWYPRDCVVMRRGRCTVCTNKCPVGDHVKEKGIYVNKTRRVKRFNTALLEDLEKQMKELTAEKTQCLEDTYNHLTRLNEIALNVDSVSIRTHLDFLIEKMDDKEKVEKLEELKGRMDERSHSGLFKIN